MFITTFTIALLSLANVTFDEFKTFWIWNPWNFHLYGTRLLTVDSRWSQSFSCFWKACLYSLQSTSAMLDLVWSFNVGNGWYFSSLSNVSFLHCSFFGISAKIIAVLSALSNWRHPISCSSFWLHLGCNSFVKIFNQYFSKSTENAEHEILFANHSFYIEFTIFTCFII